MSTISEDCYCAGWMSGNEFTLWRMHEGGPRGYGLGEVSESDIAELRRLAAKAGGWWYWDDTLGGTFVPMADWLLKLPPAADAVDPSACSTGTPSTRDKAF